MVPPSSCFSTLFTLRHPQTYDLAELGRYYRAYQAMMEYGKRFHRQEPSSTLTMRIWSAISTHRPGERSNTAIFLGRCPPQVFTKLEERYPRPVRLRCADWFTTPPSGDARTKARYCRCCGRSIDQRARAGVHGAPVRPVSRLDLLLEIGVRQPQDNVLEPSAPRPPEAVPTPH